MADRRRTTAAVVAALTLAVATAAGCANSVGQNEAEDAKGVLYGLDDDHQLRRWQIGEAASKPVLDLSGVWEKKGDVGTVLRASLSIDPGQRYASWIAGGTPDAELMIGDLNSGETSAAVAYPLDHACLDPAWLADGSSLLVHRAAVWGDGGDPANAVPMPVSGFGPTEWHSPEAEAIPTSVDLERPGCRLRWYTAEDGSSEGLYHDLDVTEFYRVDATGVVLETIPVSSLTGAEPLTIGLVDVDPEGRYACVVDGYGEHGAYKGGFTMRAQSGTRVVDLESGEAVGAEDAGCEALHADGYVSREGGLVRFIDYEGETVWETELPTDLEHSPYLFYFATSS